MAKKHLARPHTKEWFEELRERNPEQAEITQQMIALAGTERCCSICGDTENIADYMSDETVAARLCDDCKKFQEKMYGAMFLPLVE